MKLSGVFFSNRWRHAPLDISREIGPALQESRRCFAIFLFNQAKTHRIFECGACEEPQWPHLVSMGWMVRVKFDSRFSKSIGAINFLRHRRTRSLFFSGCCQLARLGIKIWPFLLQIWPPNSSEGFEVSRSSSSFQLLSCLAASFVRPKEEILLCAWLFCKMCEWGVCYTLTSSTTFVFMSWGRGLLCNCFSQNMVLLAAAAAEEILQTFIGVVC